MSGEDQFMRCSRLFIKPTNKQLQLQTRHARTCAYPLTLPKERDNCIAKGTASTVDKRVHVE